MLEVDGVPVTDSIVSISASYRCKERLNINVTSKNGRFTSDLFNVSILPTGEIIKANFTDKRGSFDQTYRTADFIPSSTFNIESIRFIEDEKLDITFSGILIKPWHAPSGPPERIMIRGEVKIRDFFKSNCNVFNDFIRLNDDITFLTISRVRQGSAVWIDATSLNGYNFRLTNLSGTLSELPLGTYNFDNNTTTSQKIELKKFIGLPRAIGSITHIPSDWQNYETAGSFTVVEKVQIGAKRVVKLKLNFTASINGVTQYTFTDAPFETAL